MTTRAELIKEMAMAIDSALATKHGCAFANSAPMGEAALSVIDPILLQCIGSATITIIVSAA